MTMDQNSIDEQEWANPENWSDSSVGLYFSKRDSRVLVPKRTRALGWTFNLAHPKGAVGFVAVMAVPTVLLLIVVLVVSLRR